MNGTQTVDPRVIAEALQMDMLALAEMLCTFASDALPTETWINNRVKYGPLSLDDFDEAAAGARRHLEAAQAAHEAWLQDNPE